MFIIPVFFVKLILHEYLIAGRNSERLLSLVNDLLDIQKLESGQLQLDIHLLEVADFLNQAITSNQPYFDQYQVTVKLQPIDKNWKLEADVSQLMQVMNNLLSNAAKFSPANSTVEVYAKPNGKNLKVAVSDQGTGIPATFQPYVFDRFTQADSSDTRLIGGTGLGLNISKQIIKQHQGQIGFNTYPGKGTEFYFELPLIT